MINDSELFSRYVPEEILAHFQKKFPSVEPSVLHRQIAEFIKFLLIAGLKASPGDLPVSREIDAIWHEWILETRQYEMLCLNSVGRFIHHSAKAAPSSSADSDELGVDLEQHLFFLAAYVLNFGRFDEERLDYWLAARHIMRLYDLTLEQLNNLAQDLNATVQNLPHLALNDVEAKL
jgi:hypothetical protein